MRRGRRDSTSGARISVWTRSTEIPKLPMITEDTDTDVCVIGAGITGLSVAHTLAREGVPVVVVDDGAVGSGETGRTSAHLASAVDDYFHVLEKLHGPEAARAVGQSHAAAIDRIESTAVLEGIDCDFERVDGYLISGKEETATLDLELRAARRAGLEAEWAADAPIPSFRTGPALRFPNQAQFHPLRYLAGLAEAVVRRGGRIFTGGHAVDIRGGREAQVRVRSGYRIRSKWVVVATNVPVNDRMVLHTKLEPHRTYVLALRVPRGALPQALIWDTLEPYHYVRVVRGGADLPGHDLLLVGGEDHKTGKASDFDARYARLEEWARERWPEAGEIHARWSGQIVEPVDGLAYIGRNPGDRDNVLIAAGDSGNGLTHGVIAGMILPDLILGRWNPWTEVYDPGRISVRAGTEFLRHNLATAVRYADWIRSGEREPENALAPGQGAVYHGLRPMAVYRDAEGLLHRMSAVCPHLKCLVTWNASEKSWDCPCHGSRFDCRGHVVNGPANRDLTRVHISLAIPEPKRIVSQ